MTATRQPLAVVVAVAVLGLTIGGCSSDAGTEPREAEAGPASASSAAPAGTRSSQPPPALPDGPGQDYEPVLRSALQAMGLRVESSGELPGPNSTKFIASDDKTSPFRVAAYFGVDGYPGQHTPTGEIERNGRIYQRFTVADGQGIWFSCKQDEEEGVVISVIFSGKADDPLATATDLRNELECG